MTDFIVGKVDPCPGCGELVRRFASVPIRGSGLDGEPSGPWWCAKCLHAKCDAAAQLD